MLKLMSAGDTGHESPSWSYPAIALPTGSKDQLRLPPQHEEHFRATLDGNAVVDVLLLGYSGIDDEILKLFKDATCDIRRLTIVNAGVESALEVYRRVSDFGIEAEFPDIADSFARWIDNQDIRRWVDDSAYAPRGVVSPQEALNNLYQEERARARSASAQERDSLRNRPA